MSPRASGRRKTPPVEALVELVVEAVGARGDGVARYRDAPVFLPFTAAGDRVRAELGARRGEGREGRVVEMLDEGPGRVRPPCVHFGRCGGCSLQHLEPGLYESVKLASLRNALARAGIDPALVGPLQRFSGGLRRRIRLGVTRPAGVNQQPRIGFRERFRHDLVDLQQCIVLDPALFAVVAPLRRHIADLLAPGSSADATLTATDSGVDMLIAAAAPPDLSGLEALAELAAECDLARIVWRTPSGDLPVVERRPPRLLLSGVAVTLPPGAFVQASAAAEAAMVAAASAATGSARPLVDLYAGLGSFTFAAASGGGAVHAVEGDAAAVAALAAAAGQRPGVSVERRDLARDPLPAAALDRFAAAIFDPPRTGAAAQAATLARSAIATIVAVSCNPATFVRDAGHLIAGGFRLESVSPIDQFVWTADLELVAVFRR